MMTGVRTVHDRAGTERLPRLIPPVTWVIENTSALLRALDERRWRESAQPPRQAPNEPCDSAVSTPRNMSVRSLEIGDVDRYLRLVSAVEAGSGEDGEGHSHPYSAAEPFDLDAGRHREVTRPGLSRQADVPCVVETEFQFDMSALGAARIHRPCCPRDGTSIVGMHGVHDLET